MGLNASGNGLRRLKNPKESAIANWKMKIG
jgi:hypothetical protein